MGLKRVLLLLITQSFLLLNVLGQQKEAPCSCCEEAYHQFDFWVGDWVVYSQGKMAGFNKITKIEDGCVIRENWKSAGSDYSGTSYNFYDQVDKVWKQVWVDNQGSVLELKGQLKDNKMIMMSQEKKGPGGKTVQNRVTWTNNPDGTLRQVWEVSEDRGISYTVLFDGLYRKRKLP